MTTIEARVRAHGWTIQQVTRFRQESDFEWKHVIRAGKPALVFEQETGMESLNTALCQPPITPTKPSATPRTDAAASTSMFVDGEPVVEIKVCRQLERELSLSHEETAEAIAYYRKLEAERLELERVRDADAATITRLSQEVGDLISGELARDRLWLDALMGEKDWRECARRLAATLRSELRGKSAVYSETNNPCALDDLAEFDRLKLKSSP